MSQRNPASLAVFAAVALCLAPVAGAQNHGSSGSRASGSHGSVSSPARTTSRPATGSQPRHRRYGEVWAPYYPYMSWGSSDPDPAASYAPEDQYNGGPTIFDRRGNGMPRPTVESYDRSYYPTPNDGMRGAAESASSPQADVLLVFKDGHEVSVGNYAIVGGTLIDMSEGAHQKFALADVDVDATVKQNGARGVDFKLPTQPVTN